MSTSYDYIYPASSPYNTYFRLEVAQVDNTAAAVNVAVNFQYSGTFTAGLSSGFVKPFLYPAGYQSAGEGTSYFLSVKENPSGTEVFRSASQFSGDDVVTTSGWHTYATWWIGTLSRANGTGFRIDFNLFYFFPSATNYRASYFDTSYVTFKGYVPDDSPDTISSNLSQATLGSAVIFTISNPGTGAHTDTLTYSIGSASGTISSNFSVPQGGSTTVSWTPPASLGAQFPSSQTSQCTISLTINRTDGTGSTMYTSYIQALKVPTYDYNSSSSLTITYSKQNYTTIGSSSQYVAGRHLVRFKMPTFPDGKFGASITGKLAFYYTGGGDILKTVSATSGQNIDYTPPMAGTLVARLTLTDSRNVELILLSSGVPCVANPGVELNFTAERPNEDTDVELVASGTYGTTITGLTASLVLKQGTTTLQTVAGSSGTASTTYSTTLGLTDTAEYTASMTDNLGNVSTKTILVPIAFSYMEVGTCLGKGIAFGRAGTVGGTEDKMEIGMPVEIGDPLGAFMIRFGPITINGTNTWEISILNGGNKVMALNSLEGLTFYNYNGQATNNYPAQAAPQTAYWNVTDTGYRLRADSTGSGTILVNSVPTGEYRYLGSTNGWANIYYSSTYPSGWISESSGQIVYH